MVAAFHDALALRILRRQRHQPGRQRPHEGGHAVGPAGPASDTRIVVPEHPSRDSSGCSSSHDPSRGSSLLRVGIIRPTMNLEWDNSASTERDVVHSAPAITKRQRRRFRQFLC